MTRTQIDATGRAVSAPVQLTATPITATKIGVTDVQIGGRTVGVIAAHTQYLSPFNLNGLPALTLPSGLGAHGLPLGLQIVSGYLQDARLLQVAQWCAPPIGFRHQPPELD